MKQLIAQFADDTQLFLDSEKSMKNAITTLDIIEANIGLRVNYDKTNVIRIGNIGKCCQDKSLIWDPGGLVVLGIGVIGEPKNQYLEILKKSAMSSGYME